MSPTVRTGVAVIVPVPVFPSWPFALYPQQYAAPVVVSAHVCAPVTTDWIAGGGSEVVGPPPPEPTGSLHAENRTATASVAAAATERREEAWRNMEGRALGSCCSTSGSLALPWETSFRG